MRRPAADAMRGCDESAAGIDDAPGSVRPSASTAAAIVDAVPIVMQVPNERAMPSSISRQAQSSSSPARFSSQYFHTSVPEPRISPRQLPRSIGPAGTKIAGRFALVAPITSAGHRLVAAAQQHDAVGGIGAQRFLGVHRQQVAIEHRAGLHERLAQREDGNLHREAAGLPDAALHVLRAQLEMRVAGVGVAPGVQDRDHRLAADVVGAEAGLLGARAVTEGAEVLACRTSDGCADRPGDLRGGALIAATRQTPGSAASSFPSAIIGHSGVVVSISSRSSITSAVSSIFVPAIVGFHANAWRACTASCDFGCATHSRAR